MSVLINVLLLAPIAGVVWLALDAYKGMATEVK
jgi:hypothetical protein